MNRVRAIIVDDEPLARQRIRTLLNGRDEIEIVAECSDGNAALTAIHQRHPDLVFLDIQMPELDGFEVVAAVGAKEMPAVVFITAYDQYAIRAFEVNAVDYLLKPFDRERFETALARALEAVHHRRTGSGNLSKLVKTLEEDKRLPDRIIVRSAGRISAIRVDEIEWIEAAGNYVTIHASGRSHLHRETLKSLEETLDSKVFVRVHRSAIINVSHVSEIRSRQSGDSDILLKSGSTVPLSRRYRVGLDRALKRRK